MLKLTKFLANLLVCAMMVSIISQVNVTITYADIPAEILSEESAPITTMFPVTEDTYVQRSEPSVNYEQSPIPTFFNIRNASGPNIGYTKHAYLKVNFGSLPSNMTIDSAKFYFYVVRGTTTEKLNVIPVSNSWDANTITWDSSQNISAGASLGSVSVDIIALVDPPVGKEKFVDATAFVKEHYNSDKTVSFKITANGESGNQTIASSEIGEQGIRPYLEITYREPSDADKAAEDKAALNISYDSVSPTITLPSEGLVNGSGIIWSSDKPGIITNTGAVTRPTGNDETVTLTATIKKGVAEDTKIFTVEVLMAGSRNLKYNVAEDTYVHGGNATTPYGNSEKLETKDAEGEATDRNIYMKSNFGQFDASSARKARLHFYVEAAENNGEYLPGEIYAHWTADDSWDSSTLTWNLAKNITKNRQEHAVQNKAVIPANGVPGWYSMDVTDYVNGQMRDKIISLVLIAQYGEGIFVISSSKSANKPYLQIIPSEMVCSEFEITNGAGDDVPVIQANSVVKASANVTNAATSAKNVTIVIAEYAVVNGVSTLVDVKFEQTPQPIGMGVVDSPVEVTHTLSEYADSNTYVKAYIWGDFAGLTPYAAAKRFPNL